MKKILNILIATSFLLPIAYFNLILFYVGYEFYFRDMYYLLGHWTTGEMGWYHIYPFFFGLALIIVKNLYSRQWRTA